MVYDSCLRIFNTMSEFKPITFDEEYTHKYWDGFRNFFVRQYTYLQRGFSLVNEAKNYILIFLGSLWTAKAITFFGFTINPNWVTIGAIVGFPCLIVIGRWDLFKASKSREFITNQHGTVTAYNSYNMSVKMVELQELILEELKKINQGD